jgi:hypothetical protein
MQDSRVFTGVAGLSETKAYPFSFSERSGANAHKPLQNCKILLCFYKGNPDFVRSKS